jgi:hypothetical protein
MLIQATNDNPNSWGDVLNVSAIRLLEDAIAGAQEIDVTSGSVSLIDSDTNGGPSGSTHPRYMIMNVIGTPGVTTTITVPSSTVAPESLARTKIYLVNNQSDSTVTVLTDAGGSTGADVPTTEVRWVYVDGTDGILVDQVASNALNLGGVPAASYAQLGVAQTFTKGQVTDRVAVSSSGGNLQIDCAASNAFFMTTTESFTMIAPQNATDGQQFTLAVQQGGGGPHTIGFAASTFVAAGASAPVLSTVAGNVDYLGFEYIEGLAAPLASSRWVVSILNNLGDL